MSLSSSSPIQSRENQRKNGSPIPVTPAVRPVMNRIVLRLRQLLRHCPASPLDATFSEIYGEICAMIDEYQDILVRHSEYSVTCTRGCGNCCNHWVEDVNSFEAEIISDYIRKHTPEKIGRIIGQCREDCLELERLQELVDERVSLLSENGDEPGIDNVDLLLGVFYQMRRPCPLLAEDGTCSVYAVRPITCRIYVSFSDPMRCDPDYITTSIVPTAILDLSETANKLLDTLHFNYMRFDGDTGLRSLLLKYLAKE